MRLTAHQLNLKQRVTLALTALVAVFVVMQGSMAYLSMSQQEDELVDGLVLVEAKRLATHIAQDSALGIPETDLLTLSPNFSAWVMAPDGSVTPQALPERLRELPFGLHRFDLSNTELHVYVTRTTEGVLYLEYDAAGHEAKVYEFGYYLVGFSLLCIVLGAIAARQIAAIVVAPIERLSRRLVEWAPGALPNEVDEETQFTTAFRRVQERFEEGVAHEREFMANARHEIRTPLAALRTDLEMLSLQADTALQPRLQRSLDTVDEITGSLDLIHTLSLRNVQTTELIDLANCVDAAWGSLAGVPGIETLDFLNEVDQTVCLNADRHALLTILRNLIRNTAEHAAASQCTVTYTERGIEIADNGIGIPASELPLLFDRYYRGRRMDAPVQAASSDRGLGLAIARQVADLHGWQLSVESEIGSGTRFILRLATV